MTSLHTSKTIYFRHYLHKLQPRPVQTNPNVLPSVYSPYAARKDTGWGRGSLGRASRRGLDARRRVNKMILRDDGWPCFAGRSCGRGRPQPQCGWARYVSVVWVLQRSETVAPKRSTNGEVLVDGLLYVSGAWLLQRSETVAPTRGLQRTDGRTGWRQ